jgi:hypothetical protein
MRGHALENRMHEIIVAGCNCELLSLPMDEKGKALPPVGSGTITLPPLKSHIFKWQDMSDWKKAEPGGYYKPQMTNFGGVDGIALMERKQFDGMDGICAVGYQSTVARVHGKTKEDETDHEGQKKKKTLCLRTMLRRIRDHLRKITKDNNLPLFLVFVTTPNGINRAQPLAKKFINGDADYLQFSLRANWFDEILDKLQLPRPTADDEEEMELKEYAVEEEMEGEDPRPTADEEEEMESGRLCK